MDAAGVFLQGRQVNYIAFAHASDAERGRVLMHELAHLVVSNSGQDVPVWLHEGLAEYYSTIAISTTGEHVLIGSLIQRHLNRLRGTKLLTLEELLTITAQSPLYNEGTRQSVFYAQAWALAHMLHNGQPKRVAELNAYVERVSAGMEPVAAWRAAFADTDVMAELERYIRRLQFTAFAFPLSAKLAEMSGAAVAEISRADVDAFLGHLLVRQEDAVGADARFAAAEKREPGNVRARLGRVVLDQERGQMDASAARLAGMARPDDWLLAYQMGMSKAELVYAGKLPPTSATAADVRALFAPAMSAGRVFPSVAATMGQVEMSGLGQPSKETRAAIEQARARTAGYQELEFVYAQLLMRAGELDAARQIATPLAAPRQTPAVRELARKLMTQIDARSAQAAGRGITSRVPAPGEQRSDGRLRSITCAADTGVMFHLDVPAADGTSTAESFVAPRLEDVQLVSQRDDFRGPIGCGPLKEPMPVRLIWLPSPDGARRVVAIEFRSLATSF